MTCPTCGSTDGRMWLAGIGMLLSLLPDQKIVIPDAVVTGFDFSKYELVRTHDPVTQTYTFSLREVAREEMPLSIRESVR